MIIQNQDPFMMRTMRSAKQSLDELLIMEKLIAFGFVTLAIFSTSCQLSVEKGPAYQVIQSRDASDEAVQKALRALPVRVLESPQFWSRIANDSTYSDEQRRLSILQLFKRHIKPGTKLSQVYSVLGDAEWLNVTNITIIRAIGGAIPIEFRTNAIPVVIKLLPNETEGRTSWTGPASTLWLSVEGKLKIEELYNCLKVGCHDSKHGQLRIIELESDEIFYRNSERFERLHEFGVKFSRSQDAPPPPR